MVATQLNYLTFPAEIVAQGGPQYGSVQVCLSSSGSLEVEISDEAGFVTHRLREDIGDLIKRVVITSNKVARL